VRKIAHEPLRVFTFFVTFLSSSGSSGPSSSTGSAKLRVTVVGDEYFATGWPSWLIYLKARVYVKVATKPVSVPMPSAGGYQITWGGWRVARGEAGWVCESMRSASNPSTGSNQTHPSELLPAYPAPILAPAVVTHRSLVAVQPPQPLIKL